MGRARLGEQRRSGEVGDRPRPRQVAGLERAQSGRWLAMICGLIAEYGGGTVGEPVARDGGGGKEPKLPAWCAASWESRWLGTAAAEKDGGRWVDLAVGDRSADTFLRLYDRLADAMVYCSDCYAVNRQFPQDRRCAGKGGAVNRTRGCIRCLRSKLNRLMRQTKGYTKSVAMPVYSPAPV